jgi:hypothetical protein
MVRRFGVKATVEHALRTLFWPVADVGTLLVFARNVGSDTVSKLANGLQVRMGTVDDCADMAKMVDSPLPGHRGRIASPEVLTRRSADYERRLARGDRLYVIFDSVGGQPVHMRWNTTHAELIPECLLWIVPPPGTAYTFDVFTHDAFRGRDLIAHSRTFSDADLRALGIDRVYWYVRHDNHSCLRARPANAEDHQRLRYLRLGSPTAPVFVSPLGALLPPISRHASR